MNCTLTLGDQSAVFLVTNLNWQSSPETQNTVTLFRITTQSGNTVYKTVLLGDDCYSVTKSGSTQLIVTNNKNYYGTPAIYVIDLTNKITAIS